MFHILLLILEYLGFSLSGFHMALISSHVMTQISKYISRCYNSNEIHRSI